MGNGAAHLHTSLLRRRGWGLGVSYNQGQLDDGISWDSEETESHVILMLLQLKMFCVKKDRTIDHKLHMNEQI